MDPAQVWAGNGSNEVLQHIVLAFGGPGRTALGFTPAYSMHPIITHLGRAPPGSTGCAAGAGQPFDLTAESAVAQVREHDPHVVFLCSPNNPTGTALGLDVVEAVYAAAERAVVVVDEAYAEFARPGTPSALTLLAGRPRLVVTRTMSKAFAFAGGRLGYLAADPALVDALRLVRLPYHLSAPTQAIALAALRHADPSCSAPSRRSRTSATGWSRGWPSSGSNRSPATPTSSSSAVCDDAAQTWRDLLDRGVLVRDVGIPHYLRVTAGTPDETGAFLAAMAQIARPEQDRSAL